MSIHELRLPFMDELKANYQTIRDEYLAFREDPNIPRENFSQMSTAKKALRSDKSVWKVYAFYIHHQKPVDFIQDHNLTFNEQSTDQLITLLDYIGQNHFKKTTALVENVYSNPDHGMINVWFSTLEPDARLGLHTNYDPYMYRAHLGLCVPDGDIGFKVKDARLQWREGDYLTFDPVDPHTAWNFTDSERTVLICDFFKPEGDRDQLAELERVQVKKMLEANPMSFGMSGGFFDLDEETKQKYAIPEVG